MATPISSGESSWMKWMPATVTSVWSGQARQNSRWRPVRMAPGSAFTNSLGTVRSAGLGVGEGENFLNNVRHGMNSLLGCSDGKRASWTRVGGRPAKA
ncbi:MAG: hypothetical protein WAK82_41615, partial [Streptosporangiaceae bacterium]